MTQQRFQYQIKTEAPPSATDPATFFSFAGAWSTPVRRVVAIAVTAQALAYSPFFAGPPEVVTVDKWFHELSTPVRFPPNLRAPRQQAFFAEPNGMTVPETVMYSKFAYPWSEPVRFPLRLKTGLHQTLAFQPAPSPFVATGWYAPWRDPVRFPPRLKTGLQQTTVIRPLPVVSFGWYHWLAEPVRFPLALKRALQQFDPLQVPVVPKPSGLLEGWYNWWSEPVRFPRGLKVYLQQTTAMPPRLLPTPTVTGTLQTTESGDLFLAGEYAFNQVSSADVGIIELVPRSANTGIIETTATSANVGQVVNPTATASGTVVSSSFAANVSIKTV